MISAHIVRDVLLMLTITAAFAATTCAQGQADEVGDCTQGTTESFLAAGNVRAKIINNGNLFWNGGQSVYEVPKGSGIDSHFTMGLMIAGRVDDSVRASVTTYGHEFGEFWPGPIPDDGSAPTDCDRFDRIWSVRSTGPGFPKPATAMTGDVENWPAHFGAPFVDVAGSPESYDPDEGDHPELVGDQMLWWIMNDRGNEHRYTNERPLGIEVRVTAFAFATPNALGNQTFYRYRIRNRSNREIRKAYMGFFNDADLGASYDDRIGSDSSSGLAYFYNADDFDGTEVVDVDEYGTAPPAVGFTAIRRPPSTVGGGEPDCAYGDGKVSGLTNHIGINSGGGPTGDRISGSGEPLYGYMRSTWLDGTPLTIGGNGYHPGLDFVRTNFIYPGNPAVGEYWSELNTDGEGREEFPADRRSIISVGPFCLGPGDETEAVFAVLWARGDSNLDSVTRLRAIGEGMVEVGEQLLEHRHVNPDADMPPDGIPLSAGVYPNPATDAATLRISLPQSMDVQVGIFDTLGRRMADVVDARLDAGDRSWSLPTSDWPPGVYLVRIKLDHITETRRLVVTR